MVHKRKEVVNFDSPTVKSATKNQRSKNNYQSAKDRLRDASTIGVYLRLRPLESDHESKTIFKLNDQEVKTLPPNPDLTSKKYSFTHVFENSPQEEIFDKVARPVTDDFISSAKDGLIFTYGVTNSGKTYTMEGSPEDPGLIYRTFDFLFNSVGSNTTPKGTIESDGLNGYRIKRIYPQLKASEIPAYSSDIREPTRTKETSSAKQVDPSTYFCVFLSLVEFYNKQVNDLFENLSDKDTTKNTDASRKKVPKIIYGHIGMSYVANVVELEVTSADEAIKYYQRGIKKRKTGSTKLNQDSSRGHCVLTLRLVRVKKSLYGDYFDEVSLKASQLCLVDLAGSERSKKSDIEGAQFLEAGNINNSLGQFRQCIKLLRNGETANVPYRGHSLTGLFKSYFQGHGSVRMVLCVNPTADNFDENNYVMEFGVITQDVAVDYAPPPKQLKRSAGGTQDLDNMDEYVSSKHSHYEPNPDLPDEEFISDWIDKLKSNRQMRKRDFAEYKCKRDGLRQNIVETLNANAKLEKQYKTKVEDLKNKENELDILEDKFNSAERSRKGMGSKIESLESKVRELDTKNKQARITAQELKVYQAQNEKVYRDVLSLVKSEQNRSETLKQIMQILKRMKSHEWTNSTPSAPEMEPLHSSSPVHIPNPSTTDTTESHTVPTMTNSSSEVMDYQDHRDSTSPVKIEMTSPSTGIPVVNPRYNRSLSCSSMQWIHHKPRGTIDTGTVLKPKVKNSRSVKNLRSSDIMRKDAAGYSVVHQDADSNGDVETSIYKGHIISTRSGGVQVILNDIETMRQVSPKRRRRAASDAHFTH